MPINPQALANFHAQFGYKKLNRSWAKVEILLGLSAAGLGLFLGDWLLSRSGTDVSFSMSIGALVLFVLGCYLALAGNRSHLYQSANEHTALLLDQIKQLKNKDN